MAIRWFTGYGFLLEMLTTRYYPPFQIDETDGDLKRVWLIDLEFDNGPFVNN
jgi:hypothetical protein